MALMASLTVELGERSYPIHMGSGVLSQPELFRPHLRSGRPFIVTNTTVAPLYLEALRRALGGHDVGALTLPDGEAHKTLETAGRVYDALLAGRHGRDSVLVALGGGVIGDLTGFVAATYQRGIGFIQVPTTLLAQVDSSVGGKTGVNHPLGKNMIGAFHQPLAVVADTDTLHTLPPRELSAGLAEVIKYGLLGDAPFFDWLESNMDRLRTLDAHALTEAIRRSCANKARIVALDERESGPRALLNLGHTFGHAIEAALGYGRWLHGEAVGAGLCMAADLSRRLGWLAAEDRDRVIALVGHAGLPTRLPAQLRTTDFQRLMAHDKKVQAGKLRLVLLKAIGTAVVTADFDPAALAETVAHYCAPPHAA
jgi:3-dehydroquinate synthase